MYFLFLTFAERTEAVYNHNFVCGIIPDVMVFSEEWRRLFHDVILTALWRYLPFLFNFKEVLYVQYLYLTSNCAI